MSVVGWVIEIREMTIRPWTAAYEPTATNRLWVMDRNGRETCVYAERYPPGCGPGLGDQISWQANRIFFDGDHRSVLKIGCSFPPPMTET